MEGRDGDKQTAEQQDTLLGLPPRKTRIKNKKQAQKKQASRISAEKQAAKSENEVSKEQVKASSTLASGGGWKIIVPLAGAIVVAGVLFIWKEMNSTQPALIFSGHQTRTDAIASGTGVSVTGPEPLVNKEGTDQANVTKPEMQPQLEVKKPANNSAPGQEGDKGGVGTQAAVTSAAKPTSTSAPTTNKTTVEQKTSPASVLAPASSKPETTISEEKPAKKIKSKLYKVKRGDNLHKISRAYYGNNNGVKRIATFNGLDTEAPLIEGKTLYIPVD
ncbi:LysM peptidoglycan-binding domain-containing protein [Brevibacillus laterosporus]|uniref:LysM peptidoglycan-binding domain-containing protein n=1 Tax=Brevibacillus laterosporus TaxID=1465 RepID=UPI002653B1D3|nr:LysM peptidoglycan-binding domain-containing protein [Brevibacillus laterosporus]MDN9008841.1 LysM peptidoglycan-binding domain-containing protein [Brevibacillus laterosporus]MDO0940948.1 LysM peptidoglycan-binding domain-containing protein [Brevibacillus laterosporus]